MAVIKFYDDLTSRLRVGGDHVWPLALRLILAWEFWESGITKLRGTNWFADIPWSDWQKGFPFPFDSIPADLNWLLATWGELILAVMLLLGLFTRFTAISLIVITSVATAAVHWPTEWDSLTGLWSGYVISADGAGNFKIPLLFIVMLLPLVFRGAGPLSFDHLLIALSGRREQLENRTGGLQSIGLALLVLSLTTIWVEPVWGFTLLAAAAIAMAVPEMTGKF